MRIHQLWIDFGKGKKWQDDEVFSRSVKEWKELCDKNGYEYTLWGDNLEEELLKHYDFKEFLSKCSPIHKHDFIKILCLYHYGGVYVDMDIFPTCDNLDWVKMPMIRKTNVYKPFKNANNNDLNIDLIAMEKNSYIINMDYFQDCIKEYHEKYDRYVNELKWLGRFVFQTTGPYHMKRWLKKRGYWNDINWCVGTQYNKDKINYVIEDSKFIVNHQLSWLKKNNFNKYKFNPIPVITK